MERNTRKDDQQMLPKSRQLYLKTYDNFMEWRSEKQLNMNTFSESDFLTYFDVLSKKLQPPSLWSIYSMLKTTLKMKHDIDLKTFTKLTSFLKRLSSGHKIKKSKVFTANQVETFLNTAPDERYLATKVALIFGISGACRAVELANITMDDITMDTHLQAVNLPNTKTNQDRTFIIKGQCLNIVKKYQALRPQNLTTNRHFLNYQNGKCTKQVIGRNKFAVLPKQIATFLKLENPEEYTGHCFRRTAAVLLGNSGANLTMLKLDGGWTPDQVPEGDKEDSVENKCKIIDSITDTMNLDLNEPSPSTSSHCISESNSQPSYKKYLSSEPSSINNIPSAPSQIQTNTVNMAGKTIMLNIQNCKNFTLKFN